MEQNLVLIGFMGTGKTVVGRRLALRLGRRFIDTDAVIEEITGLTIPRIFARYGVVRFRAEEALLVQKLAREKNLVIATGGGTVLNPENIRLLHERGILIGLTAPVEILYQRLRNKKNRPLLRRGNFEEKINSLLAEREGAYSMAEYTVNTGALSPDQVVNRIISYLKAREQV
ncbi:MAG: shikimate kinase [Bacillota bacterium]